MTGHTVEILADMDRLKQAIQVYKDDFFRERERRTQVQENNDLLRSQKVTLEGQIREMDKTVESEKQTLATAKEEHKYMKSRRRDAAEEVRLLKQQKSTVQRRTDEIAQEKKDVSFQMAHPFSSVSDKGEHRTEWSCSMCTYLNNPQLHCCEMCGEKR